jgi:hypothetical protein
VTVLAGAVRLRDLREREGLRDREREAPGLDQLADPGERVDRAVAITAKAGTGWSPRDSAAMAEAMSRGAPISPSTGMRRGTRPDRYSK